MQWLAPSPTTVKRSDKPQFCECLALSFDRRGRWSERARARVLPDFNRTVTPARVHSILAFVTLRGPRRARFFSLCRGSPFAHSAPMDERLTRETEGLVKSWNRHDEGRLREYLVADAEDPRLNVQSILTRHFLMERITGERFGALMEQELRFALFLNWLRREGKRGLGVEDWPVILHALERQADNAEGLPIPRFVTETFADLPAQVGSIAIPHYLRDCLSPDAVAADYRVALDAAAATFEGIWRKALEEEPSGGLTVLEPACGSANDYRFLDSYGLGRLLDPNPRLRNEKCAFAQ